MIRWLILVVAMTLPACLGYTYFVALGGGGATNSAVRVAYPLAKVIQLSIPILAFQLVTRKKLNPRVSRRSALIWGICFGVSTAAAIVALSWHWKDTVLADAPVRIRQKVEEFGVGSPSKFIALAAFLSLIHSFLEEYYWRWFVFGALRLSMPFAPAACLSGLAFSAHHLFVLDEYLPGRFWTAAVPLNLGIAIGGVFWAWLYERSGSLRSSWISHALVDAGIMYVGYRLVF
ncbi:MAG: CPBP family intramembrane metalloprotease [Gemmataceae bacterium]|nr:CPBP family intramembrane metalloprotease [Gemmataceae bacterium]